MDIDPLFLSVRNSPLPDDSQLEGRKQGQSGRTVSDASWLDISKPVWTYVVLNSLEGARKKQRISEIRRGRAMGGPSQKAARASLASSSSSTSGRRTSTAHLIVDVAIRVEGAHGDLLVANPASGSSISLAAKSAESRSPLDVASSEHCGREEGESSSKRLLLSSPTSFPFFP